MTIVSPERHVRHCMITNHLEIGNIVNFASIIISRLVFRSHAKTWYAKSENIGKNPDIVTHGPCEYYTPIVICRNFLSKTDCNQIIDLCDSNVTLEMNRKKKLNKFLNFYSIDVLPQKVKTNRVFRTFELSEFTLNKFLKTKIRILQLQKKILKLKKKIIPI